MVILSCSGWESTLCYRYVSEDCTEFIREMFVVGVQDGDGDVSTTLTAEERRVVLGDKEERGGDGDPG
jgi:hypothetical protein